MYWQNRRPGQATALEGPVLLPPRPLQGHLARKNPRPPVGPYSSPNARELW